MKMKRKIFFLSIPALILALWGHVALAVNLTNEEILQRYELMNPNDCRRPKAKSPALPPSSFERKYAAETTLWYERFYLDLDGDSICEILDVWVERLTPSPDDNRIIDNYAMYKYQKGRWLEKAPLGYAPKYQLRDRTTKRIYFLLDFDLNAGRDLRLSAHGVQYFDRWPDHKDSKGGIEGCSSDYICKGLDMGKIVDVLLKYQTPPFRPPLPDTYEKILINSPILKKQDAYLNGVYEYLTGGYTRGLARDAHALNCPGNVVTCFICGLPLKNIPSFKAEQKRWLAERDKAAKQAGAFGSDAYIDALIKLTSSRNAELKKRIAALPQTDPRCKDYLPVE